MKSLKSFKIVELHPKEGTPLQEVSITFFVMPHKMLVSFFYQVEGTEPDEMKM